MNENKVNAEYVKHGEREDLIRLWNKMKYFNEHESGETFSSLHKKHLRFTMEKEFVELLSNPQYLYYLAQNKYFEDERFIKYLEYLQYWQTPSYAKCLKHIHCLRFLELLQIKSFRLKLHERSFINTIHDNQCYHWSQYHTKQYWRRMTQMQSNSSDIDDEEEDNMQEVEDDDRIMMSNFVINEFMDGENNKQSNNFTSLSSSVSFLDENALNEHNNIMSAQSSQ